MTSEVDQREPQDPPPPPSPERAVLLGTVASVLAIVGGVARSKVTALVLGPGGVGLAAEIQQLVALANVPVSAFAGPVLIREVSAARGEGDAARSVRAAASWTIASSLAAALAAVVAATWFLGTTTGESTSLVALAALGTVGTSLVAVWSATLIARRCLGASTLLAAGASLASVALTVPLCWLFGLRGLFIAVAGTGAISAVLGLWLLRREAGGLVRGLGLEFPRTYLRQAVRVGGVSLIAALALQGALTLVRWVLDRQGGPEFNGQFQAAWSIGSLYFGLVFTGAGNYYFPRFAASTDRAALQAELGEASKLVLGLAVPMIGGTMALRVFAIQALYSADFEVAGSILGWQLAGDVAKACAWVQAGPLVFRGHVREFLLVEVIAAAGIGGGAVLLVPRFGAVGAGVAYFGAYVVYFIATAVVLWRTEGVAVGRTQLALVATATVGMLAVLAIEQYSIAVRWPLAAVSLLWAWRSGALDRFTRGMLKRGARAPPAQG